MKNELILDNVLTLYDEDEGADLRCAVDGMGMLQITAHNLAEPSEGYGGVCLLLDHDQMESLIAFWNEWKNKDNDCKET